MIKRFFYSSLLIVVAIGGISINAYYYAYSFYKSGYEHISWVLAVFYILLESVLWLYDIKKLKGPLYAIAVIVRYFIIIYSITITLGAQFLSTSIEESNKSKDVIARVDYQKEIDEYSAEISILNTQIQTYIDQQRIFGALRNKEDRTKAEQRRDDLTARRDLAISKRDSQVEEIKASKPRTVFLWLHERFKLGFSNGWNTEENIQIIYQLFGSILLALMAPICLSMLKYYRKDGVQVPTETSFSIDTTNYNLTEIAIQEELTTQGEPIIKYSKPDLFYGIPKHDLKDIIKMLCWDIEKIGDYRPAEWAADQFASFHVKDPSMKAHSVDDIKKIRKVLVDKNIEAPLSFSKVLSEVIA